jgi:2-phospho-L-lactate/phosphoenolpyruvate guanylyltransferase
MRALPSAKSRLREATNSRDDHARLVDAIRNDTLTAVAGARNVARIVIAVDQPWTATDVTHETYVQRAPGLNSALAEAHQWARARWPADGVAALVGDLPALRSAELDAALDEARGHNRVYVPDAALIGTTMLTALPGIELTPAFGPQSARKHDEIAASVLGAAGLRLDVDTPEELATAVRLGVGPRTTEVLARSLR